VEPYRRVQDELVNISLGMDRPKRRWQSLDPRPAMRPLCGATDAATRAPEGALRYLGSTGTQRPDQVGTLLP
jgi:hypothetical protein